MINRKSLLVVLGAAVALALGIFFWLSRATQAPLYRPGQVRGFSLEAARPGLDGGTWVLEPGVTVKVHREGEGGPKVLFVHGGPAMPYTELPAGLRALASRGFEVLGWDQRGCGGSSRPVEKLDTRDFFAAARRLETELGLTAQVADLERIRRLLGGERLLLVGHSFGALLTALYASEFPERVEALVLVAPADLLELPSPRGGLFSQIRGRLSEGKRTEFEAYLRRSFQLDALFEKTDAQLGAFNAELGQYYAIAAQAAGFEVAPVEAKAVGGFSVQAAYLGLGARHDWRELVRGVTAPVLVVHGAKDLQPEAASRAFAAAFPNARVEVLPQSGHFPFLDAPEAFAELVGRFLRELPRPEQPR